MDVQKNPKNTEKWLQKGLFRYLNGTFIRPIFCRAGTFLPYKKTMLSNYNLLTEVHILNGIQNLHTIGKWLLEGLSS